MPDRENMSPEERFIEEFLLPITRSTRGGPDLGLAQIAMEYEHRYMRRLAEINGAVPFSVAAARRDPAATRARSE